jgi:hypothetical protein
MNITDLGDSAARARNYREAHHLGTYEGLADASSRSVAGARLKWGSWCQPNILSSLHRPLPEAEGDLGMTTQTISAQPTIEWDDGVVFVFSFNDSSNTQQFAGFVHIQVQVASAVGSNTQVSQVVTVVNQQQIQFSTDPECWVETLKAAARGPKSITITYEDSINTNYTTQTNQSFQLQQLFSLAG